MPSALPLVREVLKREVTEGEKADEARRKIAKAQGRALRVRAKGVGADGEAEAAPEAPPPDVGTGS